MTITIERLNEISDNYDAFLIDAWGVLYDGGAVFPHARDCLASLKQHNKSVVIVSNAARRTTQFDNALATAGVDPSLYDFTVSSGELVWMNFQKGRYKELGENFFYLGPERSKGIFEGLQIQRVDSLTDANFILNTGSEADLEDASSFRPFLEVAISNNLPMICANPDLVAIRKGVRGIAAGAIAKLYEKLGGNVIAVGKPHQQIYEACIDRLGIVPKKKILMIGDGLQTDILGANNCGIDSLFIINGIYQQHIETVMMKHSSSYNDCIGALFAQEGATPDFVIDRLVFQVDNL